MRTILLIIGLSFAWPGLAVANSGWQQNTQLLPQYCKDRAQGSQSPVWKKWQKTFGEAFIHMHHYCNGIYAEKMAITTIDRQERNRLLEGVIGEMQYVGKHCNARCVIYADLHTRQGWALGETGQVSEAIGHFQLAIKAKPKYTLAYARLADLYVSIKQPDEAKKVLEAGLKAKPGSRVLQRRLDKL